MCTAFNGQPFFEGQRGERLSHPRKGPGALESVALTQKRPGPVTLYFDLAKWNVVAPAAS